MFALHAFVCKARVRRGEFFFTFNIRFCKPKAQRCSFANKHTLSLLFDTNSLKGPVTAGGADAQWQCVLRSMCACVSV